MYLKIDLDFTSYIIRLPDVRNVNTGHDDAKGARYYLEVCYRTGSDHRTTIYFYNRDERDEVVDKIYEELILLEEKQK